MRSKSESTKRFFVASGLTNISAYSIFASIEFFFRPSNHIVSLATASLSVLPVSYLLNRVWVFQSKNDFGFEFSRYALVYILGLLLSSIMLYALLRIFENVYIAQFISMITIAATTLILHTFWTFIRRI